MTIGTGGFRLPPSEPPFNFDLHHINPGFEIQLAFQAAEQCEKNLA